MHAKNKFQLAWPHYRASFNVVEGNGDFSVLMKSNDNHTALEVNAQVADCFPSNSMFNSLNHVSGCFHDCAVGISPSTRPEKFKMIQLKTKTWDVKPLHVHSLTSSFFDDKSLFPKDTIYFDNAILMEGIEHEWLSEG